MEDAHVVHVHNGEGYFGILDGHGGAECSEWCSKRIQEQLTANGCPSSQAAAKKLCIDVDREFLETGLPGGSTAAMCIVRAPTGIGGKYKIHVINAGDSRVLLSRADGSIVDGGGTDSGLTVDHKPNHPSERERIERCGGSVVEAAGGVHRVNGNLAVSRGFGDADCKKTGGPAPEDRPVTADPEHFFFECGPTDFVMLVCDGVSEGNFPNPEVTQLAAKVLKETGGDAAKASEAVCFRAVETGSKDNISCMIVLMGGAASAGSAPIRMGVQREFNAGSLIGCDKSSFVKAYIAMCARGGVTLAEAAEMRHTLLVSRQGKPDATDDDDAELEAIGEPEGPPGSAERKAWFEAWAQNCQERGNGGGGDDEDDGDGPSLGGGSATEQLAMMRMLLGMMQAQQGGPGGAGK